MKINILTLFPKMFDGFLSESIVARAIKFGAVEINIIDIGITVLININKLMICLLVVEMEWL